MKVIRDGLWLCVDCLMAAVNGDVSAIESDERIAEIEMRLREFVAAFEGGLVLLCGFVKAAQGVVDEHRSSKCYQLNSL